MVWTIVWSTIDPREGYILKPGEIMDLQKIAFLVVDDSKFMCDLVRGMLKAFGARKVLSSGDGRNLSHFIKKQKIDILILDWMMFPDHGSMVLKELRKVGNDVATTPTIVLTGHTDMYCLKQAVEGGADMVIKKPASARVLYKRICDLIESKRQYIQVGDYLGPVTHAHHKMMSEGKDSSIKDNTGAEYWLVQP